MIRPGIALTTALLLATTLTGCGEAASDASASKCTQKVPDSSLITPNTLTDVVSDGLPPMTYIDEDGEYAGMRVELGRMIADQLCLDFKVTSAIFDAQLAGLDGKRWDMVGSGAFYTPERAESIDMVPYEVQGVSLSVPQGNPKDVQSVEDLSGLTVAVESPGFEFDTLEKINAELEAKGTAPFKLSGFTNTTDAYNALQAGQVDAVGIIGSVVKHYSDSGQFTTAIADLNPAPLALGFADKGLAEAVAVALEEMRSDGSLQKKFDEYGAAMWEGPFEVTTGPLKAAEKTS